MYYGYEEAAEKLDIHLNTLRSALSRGDVYTTPTGKQIILSLVILDCDQLKDIKAKFAPIKSTSTAQVPWARAVYIYNKDKYILLRIFKSVNSLMSYSGRSGRDIRDFCTTGKL